MTSRFSSPPRLVFVDSSAYYAAADPRDSNYTPAQMLLAGLQRRAAHMFSTRYVLAETHALVVNRRRDSRRAAETLRQIEASASTTVVAPTDADEARARVIIEQYDDHLFTLTDAISFAVIERLSLNYAFSFDSDVAADARTAALIGPSRAPPRG